MAGPAQGNSAEALASGCAGCHGVNAHGRGGIPAIAGKPAKDFLMIMREFKSGKRPATVMHRIAAGFEDEELVALAEFFADLP